MLRYPQSFSKEVMWALPRSRLFCSQETSALQQSLLVCRGHSSGWQSLWVPGYGWFSHPGTSLYQPVPTGILQIGTDILNLGMLKALGPQLQQSIAHLPSVESCVPVPPVNSFMASLPPFYCSYCLQSALSLLHSGCLPQTCVSFPGVAFRKASHGRYRSNSSPSNANKLLN